MNLQTCTACNDKRTLLSTSILHKPYHFVCTNGLFLIYL